MEVRLSPEVAAVVEADVAAGRFASAEEYVAAAVELLHEREAFAWMGETVEEFNAKLEESIAEAERGEVFTEEQVREEMRKRKAEWAKIHPAARSPCPDCYCSTRFEVDLVVHRKTV